VSQIRGTDTFYTDPAEGSVDRYFYADVVTEGLSGGFSFRLQIRATALIFGTPCNS
jgi:hypothetical protein